jgi:hypothetical protein
VKTWKTSTLVAVALLLTTAAFAANKESLKVFDPVQVSGTQLPAGNYTVTWEGTGPSVDVTITRGKDVVAKTSARLQDLPKAPSRTGLVTKRNADGTRSLSEIQFGGKKYALEIGETTNQADASAVK